MTVADVTIERVAAGGDGIARIERDGMVVFVPRTAPGDRVRVSLTTRKRFARGRVEEMLIASPDRVVPPCEHYRVDRCGGCQLQHLGYPAQLEVKRGIIRDALMRIGKRQVDAPPIEAADDQWRYRTKLTLTMRRRGGELVIGLHPYDDPVGVFPLVDCPITDERVMAIWRQVMAARAFVPIVDVLRASVRLVGNGAAMVMEGGHAWPTHGAFFAAVPAITSLWWKPENAARTLVDERAVTIAGASFAQVNPSVGARLHAHVLDLARSHNPATVVDAYAGSGATAIPLALDGRTVIAIESDRDAVSACAAAMPTGSRAIAARVEDAIEAALPADVVLLNPPRAGVDERVASVLGSLITPPRSVIYVSCDPATLARDLSRMPRYRIASLRAFDMFPQTAHVETVCELVPEAA